MEYMDAVVCNHYGPPEVLTLQKRLKPIPKQNEILIEVYSSSVTNSDIFIRSSKVSKNLIVPFRLMIGITKPRKRILGQVFSGKVVEIGSKVKRFKFGDKVYGLTGFSLGAYAQYMKLKEIDSKNGCMAVMPRNCSFEDATSAAYGGLLALQFLEKVLISKNDNVLVYGASSTSGTFAVQYLKSLGARVTAVCKKNKHEFIKSLGADNILDYSQEDSLSKLEKYQVIIDCVGKAKTSILREESIKHITNQKNNLSIDDEALLLDSRRLDKITQLVEEGIIKPITDKIFLISEIVEAHHYVELGHKTGNVAIRIKSET